MNRKLKANSQAIGSLRVPLLRFYNGWAARRSRTWGQIRVATGGAYHGKVWRPLKAQYTRKGGVSVPVWGGVPRADGEGLVKAKKRRGNVRYKPTDVVMQSTGAMRNSWLSSPVVTDDHIIIGLGAVPYAGRQNDLRRFAFWELPRDRVDLKTHIVRYLNARAPN